MKMKRIQGFTMLEVLVSTAILAIFVIALFGMIESASSAIQNENEIASVEKSAALALNRMIEQLRESYVLDLELAGTAGADSISFLIPVDHDGDGDALDDTMAIEWGGRRNGIEYLDLAHSDPLSDQDFSTRFYWQASTGPVTSFSESARGVDVNGDGDTIDSFDIGHIEMLVAGGGATYGFAPEIVSLTPDCVLRPAGAAVGDIDGDGANDPLFFQNGRSITIRLFVMDPDTRYPMVMAVQSSVGLRNPQE